MIPFLLVVEVFLHKCKKKINKKEMQSKRMSGRVFLSYKLDLFTPLSFIKYHHNPQNLLLITLVFFPFKIFPPPPTNYFL